MTCGGGVSIFRLLDAIVGWDADDAKGLTDLDDNEGITLAPTDPGAVGSGAVDPYLPPPWLAPGCGPCEWFLATPARYGRPNASRLLRLRACGGCDWQAVWDAHCTALPNADITAIAASGHRIAVADRASAGIHLFEASGDRLAALIPLTGVMAMTFTPDGTLVVAQHGNSRLLRFDRSGAPLTPFTPALPENAQVERIGSASGRSIWLATPGKQAGTYKLWSARFGDPAFAASSLADLAAARPHTGLTAVTANGFCVARSQAAGDGRCCWSRDGEPMDPAGTATSSGPTYALRGQLLTAPIDSGVPRCIWHRVRIDADIPPGTSVAIAVATLDTIPKPAIANPSGSQPWPNDEPWDQFLGGIPHPLDWQEVSTDVD